MRKTLLSIIFLGLIIVGNTQPYPLLGSPNGNTISAVNALRAFQLPRGADTSLNGRNDTVGMLFYKLDGTVWLRVPSGGTANRWVRFGGSVDSIIYATRAWALSTFPQLALQYNDPSWIGTLNTSKLRNFGASTGQVLYFTGSSVSPNFLAVNNGWGVTGGGNLTPSRTLSVDSTVVASKDFTNATYALQNRAIVAGYGLAGGGDLSADRSFIVDTAGASAIVSKPFFNARINGVAGRVPFFTDTNSLGSDGAFLWDNAIKRLDLTGSLRVQNQILNNYNSIASTPATTLTGTWFTGGTALTTKPHFLIEPTGATVSVWNTDGTALGINAASGFTGNLMDLHINGSSQFRVGLNAVVAAGQITAGTTIVSGGAMISGGNYNLPNAFKLNWGGGLTFIEGDNTYLRAKINSIEAFRISNAGNFLINTITDAGFRLDVNGTTRLQGKLSQPTTANSPKGTATLVNGVVTINNTLATTNCFIQVNYRTGTALSGTSSILTVSNIVDATSFTVTALNAGAVTTNTSDNNIIEYTITN